MVKVRSMPSTKTAEVKTNTPRSTRASIVKNNSKPSSKRKSGRKVSLGSSNSSHGVVVEEKSAVASSDSLPNWYRAQCEVRSKLTKPYPGMKKFSGRERYLLGKTLLITLKTGDSSSVLIVGPPACGKSAVVDAAIDDLITIHHVSKDEFRVIRLNAFVQNTDSIAVREIAHQLQVDCEAILAASGDQDEINTKPTGSFADALGSILTAFRSGSRQSRALVVVLDGFEHFAARHNQLLLYTLLDASRERQVPVAIVGITSNYSCSDLLEKRVKSRFSLHQIHLHLNSFTLNRFKQVFLNLLSVADPNIDSKFAKEWNDNVRDMMRAKSIRPIVRRLFYLTKSVRSLQQLLLYPVGRVRSSHPHLVVTDLIERYRQLYGNTIARSLHDLSLLELALLISMRHLTEMRRNEPFNLRQACSLYDKFASGSQGTSTLSAMLKACERLEELELIQVVGGGGGVAREFRPMALTIETHIIVEASLAYPDLPEEMKRWVSYLACS